jgi:hypothetical protein
MCGKFLIFIRFSMFLFEILIQIIYRGRRFEDVGVGTTPQIEDAVLAPPIH